MNINKITIWLVVIGYLVVNVRMQVEFFSGRNIFAKYHAAANAVEALSDAQHAYYAKTAFLLVLLFLQACNMSFGLSFGLSFFAYAILMLIFFGFGTATTLYLLGSAALLASYFYGKTLSV